MGRWIGWRAGLASPSSPPLRRALRAALIAVALLAAGCRGLDDPGRDLGVFFPRHGHDNSDSGMLALMEGRLEVRGGCLWVVPTRGDRMLPIWPPRFGLRVTEERLTILDASGGVVARESDLVLLVGGQVDEQHAYELSARQAPAACRSKNNYWMTREVRGLGPAQPTASP